MSASEQTLRDQIRDFLIREMLQGQDAAALTDETPLFTKGYLDSISVLQYVAFLEKKFSVKLTGKDLSRRHLDTIASTAELVRERMPNGR